MGEGCGGFLKKQAVVRHDEVDAPSGQVEGDGLKIEGWVLASEGESETSFSVLVAVARARVAAGFGEDGHDFVLVRGCLCEGGGLAREECEEKGGNQFTHGIGCL